MTEDTKKSTHNAKPARQPDGSHDGGHSVAGGETKEKSIQKRADKQNIAELIKPGMTVKVHEKIKDIDAKGKERERTQVFEGIIIAIKKPKTASGTFTVRKISECVGVEKIYPINSPLVTKIVGVKQARVRRAKLYYLRNYKKKLKEKKI